MNFWLDRSFIVLFFIVWRAIGIVAGLACFAESGGLCLQRRCVLGHCDLTEFARLSLRGFAQLCEVVRLLPDSGQRISLGPRFGAAAFGKPSEQIGATALYRL